MSTAARAGAQEAESRSLRFRMTGEGYEYATDTDPHTRQERPAYIHRLAALAWGVLEDVDDSRHVHHQTSVPWLNTEDNLEAVEPREHADYHIGSGGYR